MLTGKADPTNEDAKIVPIDGFKVSGASRTGTCQATGLQPLMGDPVLSYNKDLTYGCSVEYTLAELQAECESTDAISLGITENLVDFEYFGQFGNANFYYPKVSFYL